MHKKLFTFLTAFLFSAAFVSMANAQAKRTKTPVKHPAAKAAKRQIPNAKKSAAVTTASGLTYIVTRAGTGRLPKNGETVVVHYTGTFTSGVKFDSSLDRGEPIAFKLGAGQVIKGWDEGIARLRVGDQAVFVIPSAIAYGAKGRGSIPPDATLIFIVELVEVKETSLGEILFDTLKTGGFEAMTTRYNELKIKGFGNIYKSESDLNGLGYRLLAANKITEAIAVLKLNVEAYPNSANVYDSLGEAYLAAGDKASAIENYKKALAIDPQLESARIALLNLNPNQ